MEPTVGVFPTERFLKWTVALRKPPNVSDDTASLCGRYNDSVKNLVFITLLAGDTTLLMYQKTGFFL